MTVFSHAAQLLCFTTVVAWKHETCGTVEVKCGGTEISDKNYFTFDVSMYDEHKDKFECGRKVTVGGYNFFVAKAGLPNDDCAKGAALVYLSDQPCFSCDDYGAQSQTCTHSKVSVSQGDEFCLKDMGKPKMPSQSKRRKPEPVPTPAAPGGESSEEEYGSSGTGGESSGGGSPAPSPSPSPGPSDGTIDPTTVCPAEGGGRRLGALLPAGLDSGKRRLGAGAILAKTAGKFLMEEALSAVVGYGMEEVLDMWFGPAEAIHSLSAQCVDVCRPYPDENTAQFCGNTVHSHRVHCTLTGKEAKTRDQFAYVSWEKLLLDATFKNFSENSPICKASFIDSLCLDAFPHCHCDDLTACNIACRNMNLCLAGQGKREIDCQQACANADCTQSTHKCKVTGGGSDEASHAIARGSIHILVLAVMVMSLATRL